MALNALKKRGVREQVQGLLGEATPKPSDGRSHQIGFIVHCVDELGLERCLQIYLRTHFGVETLAELEDAHVSNAWSFVHSVRELVGRRFPGPV